MLAKHNTPGYMLFYDCIRVRLYYDLEISKPQYINSNVLVRFNEYRDMINKYNCNDEMFNLCHYVHPVTTIFMQCNMPEHVKDIIKEHTYFSYNVKTWNINELIVKNIVSLLDLEEIFPKQTNYFYSLIYKFTGLLNDNNEYIINVCDMNVENCNKLFNLINIDV